MIWDNTKLLLGLLYRPVSSMGRIVDEAHWLYAAVAVAALSLLFHVAVTASIYSTYEAVYRELPVPQQTSAAAATTNDRTASYADAEYEDYEELAQLHQPRFTYDRLPLPLVGQHGWWFVSFVSPSFFTCLLYTSDAADERSSVDL